VAGNLSPVASLCSSRKERNTNKNYCSTPMLTSKEALAALEAAVNAYDLGTEYGR